MKVAITPTLFITWSYVFLETLLHWVWLSAENTSKLWVDSVVWPPVLTRRINKEQTAHFLGTKDSKLQRECKVFQRIGSYSIYVRKACMWLTMGHVILTVLISVILMPHFFFNYSINTYKIINCAKQRPVWATDGRSNNQEIFNFTELCTCNWHFWSSQLHFCYCEPVEVLKNMEVN